MELPQYIRIKHGRAYYVRKIDGKNRWKPLCRISEGEAAIRAAYEAVLEEKPRTMSDIMSAWLTHGAARLKPKTQKEYERAIRSNLRQTFGKMLPEAVQPTHIAQYLDRRAGPKGNRDIAALSTVMEWGMRKGYVVSNPCRGVRRNTERPRRRYVDDTEYEAAIAQARPHLRRIMQAAYLTGLRQGDLIALRKEQATDEGIVLAESKRGKRIVIAWSDELRTVVDEAKAASKCERVFANYYGREWTSSGVQTAMQRLWVDFTFHDLRAKAESDHESGLGLLTRYKRARRLTPVR